MDRLGAPGGTAAGPAGARVILLPAPGPAGDGALLDQAMAGMRFDMLGSYAISRDRTRQVDSHSTPDPITALAATTPRPKARQQAAARCAVAGLGVTDVLLIPALDPTGTLVAATTALYGPPTLQAGGVQVWPAVDLRSDAACPPFREGRPLQGRERRIEPTGRSGVGAGHP